jgi:hypothetical protein
MDDAEVFADPGIPDAMKIDVIGILLKVNFRDPPVIFLLFFHVFVFCLAVLVRSHQFWRVVVFVFCMAFALVSEKLGIFLAENWRTFRFSADYFDETGVFVLFFFALPPIFTCIYLLSHLIGRIGGRMIDGYVNRTREGQTEQKDSEEEEEKKKHKGKTEETETKEKTD